MTVETFTPDPLIITESAREQIAAVTTPEEPFLRIGLRGGGCSGFEYMFQLAEKAQEDDITCNGVVMDPLTLQYLYGSTVDYKKDLMGAMFTIDSPQATGSCGCGLSVSF